MSSSDITDEQAKWVAAFAFGGLAVFVPLLIVVPILVNGFVVIFLTLGWLVSFWM